MQQVNPRPGVRQRLILDHLVQEYGLPPGTYAYFFVSGEGRFLPLSTASEPVEEISGYVIADDGAIYSFWLSWDAEDETPTFTEWERVEPESDWIEVNEYCLARKSVGLID